MTVRGLLNAIKWPMYEKGLQRIWNQLDQVADAELAAYTGTVGAIDLVDDLTPDVTGTYPNPGAERLSEETPRNGFRVS